MPSKPEPPTEDLADLPDLDDPTDLLELLQGLDPGAPEPIDTLPPTDEAFPVDIPLVLSVEEPDGTSILELPKLGRMIAPADDLEDFATQDEVPILPWKLDAELLEAGLTVPAVLDPTAETTSWHRPGPAGTERHTVRLRMVIVAVEITCVDAPEPCLRVGRDILVGRLLIAP